MTQNIYIYTYVCVWIYRVDMHVCTCVPVNLYICIYICMEWQDMKQWARQDCMGMHGLRCMQQSHFPSYSTHSCGCPPSREKCAWQTGDILATITYIQNVYKSVWQVMFLAGYCGPSGGRVWMGSYWADVLRFPDRGTLHTALPPLMFTKSDHLFARMFLLCLEREFGHQATHAPKPDLYIYIYQSDPRNRFQTLCL